MWVSKHPDWWGKHDEAYKEYRKWGRYYCCVCLSKKNLVLNHMHYETFGHEDVWKDLNWMCKSCHSDFHWSWLYAFSQGVFWHKVKIPLKRGILRERLMWITFCRSFWQLFILEIRLEFFYYLGIYTVRAIVWLITSPFYLFSTSTKNRFV